MKSLQLLTVFLLFFILMPPIFPANSESLDNPIARIEFAYSNDEISNEERLMNFAYSLFAPEKLDAKFHNQDDLPLKCGTGILIEILKHWNQLSRQNQLFVESYLARPEMQHHYFTPEGHFKIHYNTSGDNVVSHPNIDSDPKDGYPDYVNRIGMYMEKAWNLLINQLGYDPPPNDNDRGGDNCYDVYLKSYTGAWGVCFFDGPSNQYPGRNDYVSYIYIDPSYSGTMQDPEVIARSVCVHEFFHAIQLTYDAYEEAWFMEVSSTWIEDVAYDDDNQHYYWLRKFFQEPHVSLTKFDGSHEYASCIWGIFLHEKYGIDMYK